MNDIPFHLFFPLASSLLLVAGLLCIKRASTFGVGPWSVTLVANLWAGLLFSLLWFLGGDGQPWTALWQPAIIASLFIIGQSFMFTAIDRGDVSLATPVFGVKIVFVAVLMATVFGQNLPGTVWFGAFLAAVGIALVQWNPTSSSHTAGNSKVLMTVALALGAAGSFAVFDVLVQHWAPAWGAGRFLPVVFWMVAVLSLAFIPAAKLRQIRWSEAGVVLLLGTFLIALQAISLVSALATFGDAARINVVYALRGMWGVGLAWLVAKRWGGSEANVPANVMIARLVGASLLTIAVILVVLGKAPE